MKKLQAPANPPGKKDSLFGGVMACNQQKTKDVSRNELENELSRRLDFC
jgi:hypothetical protein